MDENKNNDYSGLGYQFPDEAARQLDDLFPAAAEKLETVPEPAPAPPQAVPQYYTPPAYGPAPARSMPPPPAQQPPPPLYGPGAPYANNYTQPSHTQPKQPPRRKKAGTAIFCLFLAALIAFGGFVGLRAYQGRLGGGQPSMSDDAGTGDDTEITLYPVPENVGAVNAGTMSPADIFEKLRNANVAVLVYSGGSRAAVGEGSGIILHEDSTKTYTYIVTCAHVIENEKRVSIEMDDGTSYDAEVVGKDDRTDLALLRVKATGLPSAQLGDSDSLRVGDAVYAIGNPGGTEFKGSFTNGMVSAIDRSIKSSYTHVTIQHTAPINPGNSGGALVNAAGQVIGINSQKIVSDRFEGMGFAIPSKTVQEVVNNLITKGYVPNRPKLGIRFTPASETQAGYYVLRANNLPSGSLIIAKIDQDSTLQNTEVMVSDIITHVNGKPLDKAEVLLNIIENGKVNDELKLTICRVNQNYQISTFDVSIRLVEDKGVLEEATTEPPLWQPFGGGNDGYYWP
ncbi:MAG: trypsin-like peptidase domain-containing protein [Oscillospiraceae bacterium]|nr:trypsin-like peptidase domain-containing protein [Oscillospiraceae bacterium]